ncbi:putative DeoR family transcriptional regulator [Gordonia namibiensis NBRC 108229]|uniref:Putative DeoR family transcriptional regulator n=1 Tax=Gordonia namibiensis NBRC 108229 TaxID=1208314 RepID=K6WKV3_9ACTN|nr:WYL domain-containing protein [Gordonia namibiensis]GAC00016.1 putative DeoR family transcriptional regulator [Gordonia namibiensis NBRC 108229]
MRAERLIAVLMLLKKHDRVTASTIAAELEVSERTVLRDIEALSLSGVPVYAERGRHGGFSLVPGYRTDLTGLTVEEATSLLAGTGRLDSPAFASAMRKVTAALPEAYRGTAVRAAQRVLVRPEGFVRAPEDLDALDPVQFAVFAGRRIRTRYRPRGADEARERILDPVGLIIAGDTWYLVAHGVGPHDRTDERMYRLSRMSGVEVLDEPAVRDEAVDLNEIWERRRAAFRSSFDPVDVVIECAADAVEQIRSIAAFSKPLTDSGTRRRVELRFADHRHAVRALWTTLFDHDIVVEEPGWVREALSDRARTALSNTEKRP